MERSGRLKKRRKKGTYFRTFFFCKKNKIYEKKTPKGLQMDDLFRGWRLFGGSWDTFGAQAVLDPKNEPRAPPKCSPGSKITSKMTPKVQKLTPKVVLKVNSLGTLKLNIRIGEARTSAMTNLAYCKFPRKVKTNPDNSSTNALFSRKGFRNGFRNEQLLLFLAQIVVCSETAHARGGCQGASGLVHSPL